MARQRLRALQSTKVSTSLLNSFDYADWEKKTRLEYEQQTKAKKLEIQNYQKQQLKDSIRIGYTELAEVHSNFGFSNEALVMMRKSVHECTARED